MPKFLLPLILAFLSLVCPAYSDDLDLSGPLARQVATTVTIPYNATPLTTISSSGYNSNNATIAGTINGNLDSSNISSSRGIGANYIVASGSNVTGTFQAGSYTFTGQSGNQTPLTVSQAFGAGPSGSGTANIFQVCQVTSATSPPTQACPVWVDYLGVLHTTTTFSPGSVDLGSGTGTASAWWVNSAKTAGIAFNGATNGVSLFGGNWSVDSLGNAALLQGTFTGPVTAASGAFSGGLTAQSTGQSSANVPPMYKSNGSSAGATAHTEFAQCTFAASTSCTTGLTIGFTSASTYGCSTPTPSGGVAVVYYSPISGNQVTEVATSSTSGTYTLACSGY